tara:strand:+ start:887 stop:1753 length:867 start_codon:yes stop_codon:yes gene_type:complete
MSNFEEIMIKRCGKNEGKMESIEIVQILKKNTTYILSELCFSQSINELLTFEYTPIQKPLITTINGIWDTNKMIKSNSLNEINKLINQVDESNNMFGFEEAELSFSSEEEFKNITNTIKTSESNILGNNVTLKCRFNHYYFKPVIATKETVAYYDCKLIEQGESILFNSNENMAMYHMEISNNYINEYIMNEKYGGGIYLEYHNLPHIYIPVNCYNSGYIILAKKIKNNRYDATAFTIPLGKALYINPNVIHNDCFLIGNYNVVYGLSKKYSTAILKNGFKLVRFNFI